MATDLKKWSRISAILEDSSMRSSRKVVIGDGMDRQDRNPQKVSWSKKRFKGPWVRKNGEWWRIVIRSQKQRQSRKKEPKRWILESGIGTIFSTLCSPSSLDIHRCYEQIIERSGRNIWLKYSIFKKRANVKLNWFFFTLTKIRSYKSFNFWAIFTTRQGPTIQRFWKKSLEPFFCNIVKTQKVLWQVPFAHARCFRKFCCRVPWALVDCVPNLKSVALFV